MESEEEIGDKVLRWFLEFQVSKAHFGKNQLNE
jgi:hypothetical protein